MHTSLDQALGRPPRPNRVGQSILNIGGDASAAYSLRSLTGGEPKAVRIRRDGDNEERDFTTAEIGTEAADWTNGLQETALPADLGVTSFTQSGLAFGLASYGIELLNGASLDDFDGTFTPNSNGTVWSNGSPLGVNFTFDTNLNQWDLNFNDGTNFGNITISSTTKYPFQVTNWGSASVSTGVSGLQTNWSGIASYLSFTPIYGATTTYPTADAAYSLRKVRSTYTGHAVRIRREFDDIEVNVSFDTNNEVSINSPVSDVVEEGGEEGDTTATTLGEFITQDVLHYESDFTSGTNSYLTQTSNITLSAPSGSFNGEEDYLLATCSANATLFLQRNIHVSSGDTYRVDFKVFIPNANNDNTPFLNNTGTNVSDPVTVTKGSWQDVSITLAITSSTNRLPRIIFSLLAGEVLYLKDIKYTVTSGANAAVHTWYDQSGSSNNATQISDDNQPLIAQNGNLLTAGITFDGTDDFLETSQSVITQSSAGSFSYFGVSTIATDEAGYIFGSAGNNSSTGSSLYAQDVSKFSLSNGNNAARDNITRSSGENLLSACYTGGRANLRVNGGGTSVASGTYSFNANANFTIGNRESGSSAATFLAGSIKEIIAYDSDQTNNRFKIESNINNHYTIYTAAQNSFVNKWYDQSGNSKNATASADADEPEIVKNGNLLTDSGGRPEIQFDGSSHHFNVNFGSDLNQPNTIVMVHQSDTTTVNKNRFFDREGTSGDPRTLFAQINTNYRMLAQAGGDTGVAVDTNKNLVVALYNGTSSVLTKNGTASSAINSGIQGINQNSEIGRSDSSNGNYDGTMQEFIVYNANQSSVQTDIETNIANHYGITLS